MPTNIENRNDAKHSTINSALFHETETLLKSASSEQVSQVIIQLIQKLGDKVELRAYFIVNSVVVGNCINGSDIAIDFTGHVSTGDNSGIGGEISKA